MNGQRGIKVWGNITVMDSLHYIRNFTVKYNRMTVVYARVSFFEMGYTIACYQEPSYVLVECVGLKSLEGIKAGSEG